MAGHASWYDIVVGAIIFTPKDVREINLLLKQLSPSAPDLSHGKLYDIISQPNFRLLYVRDHYADKIIGVACLTIKSTLTKTIGLIDNVIIDEKYRGFRLGKLILSYLIAIATNMKAEHIDLISHPNRKEANKLYKRMGFELIGKVGESNLYRLNLES